MLLPTDTVETTAEAQAVDRVHRLGQKRPVFIKRFIMDGSFEEKMVDLQRKKKALADLTPPGHEVRVHLTLTDDHPWAQAFVLITAGPA